MITVWYVCHAKHTAHAFTGIGAQRYGGRWNSKGHPVVYTSESLALAILEVLIHLPEPNLLKAQQVASIGIVKPLIKLIDPLPADWKHNPMTRRNMGDRWLKSLSSPILAVPSILYDCALEKPTNYLINPNHPAFELLQINPFTELNVDPRIARRHGRVGQENPRWYK